jgi:catechol 2,3-dioxygenase-like lactoylglutathione lyase family enzyme
MTVSDTAPALAGIHHLKLPVADLERSIAWYGSRLGYRTAVEFIEGGTRMGVSMRHPNGGPELALRLDPERAVGAAGFDYFSFGVPDKAAMEALADRLTALGDEHAGVHFASIGWVLPMVRDPDGHEVRFYTVQQHTEFPDGPPVRVEDPRETAERMEAEMAATASEPAAE